MCLSSTDHCHCTPHLAGYPGHYDYQAYYQALSASHISSVGPTPPPPNLQPIVDKTAEYVARNSDGFERTILQKHCDDPKFNFLNPWSEYHSYYQARKMHCRERIAQEQREKESYLNSLPNVQRLGSSGAVSFKLEPKSSRVVSTGEVVDLGIGEEVEDEGERRSGEGGEEPPAAKRQCLDTCEGGDSGEGGEGEVVKEDKIGNKVQVRYLRHTQLILVCSILRYMLNIPPPPTHTHCRSFSAQ